MNAFINTGRLSVRNFVLDEKDHIYRLALSKASAMLRDPEAHLYPQFAGKRVRATQVFVELEDGRPARITRMIHFVLTFDEHGVLKKELHMRQEMARYNLYIKVTHPAEGESEDERVVDVKDRFLTSGGQWKPTAVLEDRLRDAALGKVKCQRV